MASAEMIAQEAVLKTFVDAYRQLPAQISVERSPSDLIVDLLLRGGTLHMSQRSVGENVSIMGGYDRQKSTISFVGKYFSKTVTEGFGTFYGGQKTIEIITLRDTKNFIGSSNNRVELFKIGAQTRLSEDVNGGRLRFEIPNKQIVPASYSMKDLSNVTPSQLFSPFQTAEFYKIHYRSCQLYGLDRNPERQAYQLGKDRAFYVRLVKYFSLFEKTTFRVNAIIDLVEQKFNIPVGFDLTPLIEGAPNGDTVFLFKKTTKSGGARS